MFVLCPRQDPQRCLSQFPFEENTLEALPIRFPRTLQNALIAARDQLGQAFRGIPTIGQSGANFTTVTSSAVNSDDESSVDSDDE